MSGKREMKIFSLLVNNKPGVLFRITSHFKRRNYNIESIAVGPTEKSDTSRMVIAMMGDEKAAESFSRQLRRELDVLDVSRINEENAILHELAFVKVMTVDSQARNSVLALANSSGARVLEVSKDSVIVEITGVQKSIDNFINLVSEFGVQSVSRTGVTAVERG